MSVFIILSVVARLTLRSTNLTANKPFYIYPLFKNGLFIVESLFLDFRNFSVSERCGLNINYGLFWTSFWLWYIFMTAALNFGQNSKIQGLYNSWNLEQFKIFFGVALYCKIRSEIISLYFLHFFNSIDLR